ncbi:MAG: response regulator [Anaerolineales bacterium]|jgi:DNA-binding response OmpR family regulator
MAIEVLLIDDDPDMSVILRTLLRGHDFQIQSAHSGTDGIRFCRRNRPDVVILDLMMPETDGWEVCQRIRKFSSVPILILSAIGSPAEVSRALDAGADDYLIKPVHAGLLVSRLRMLVRRYAMGGDVRVA